MTNLRIAALTKHSTPETVDNKILWYDDFEPRAPKRGFSIETQRSDKDLKALLQIRDVGLAVLNEGKMVGLNVSRATGPEGMKYLQKHQQRLGLTMIEDEKGDRFFVPKGQAKALTGYHSGYGVVSSKQQSLESVGAIARTRDSFGIYYVGTKPAGVRFLNSHHEVPQRNLKVPETRTKALHHPK